MIESAIGIILRTRLLTDTSLIVHWLTPAFGRIATVAKGARRPKSPFAGKLDLFYLCDLSFSRSRRSDLHTLREAVVRDSQPALRRDLARLRQATYAAALIEQTTETETALAGIFGLLSDLLAYLPQQPVQARSVFAFELKLLRELGLQPDAADTKLQPATRGLLAALLGTDWTGLAKLQADASQVRDLRQFLHGFLIYHLGRIPAGRANALTCG